MKPKVTFLPPQPEETYLQTFQNDSDLPTKTSLYQRLAESYREDRSSAKASLTKKMLNLRREMLSLIGEEGK